MLAPLGFVVLTKQIKNVVFKENKEHIQLYALFVMLFAFMSWATASALDITKVIFPQVYDYDVYKIDAAFGHITNIMMAWFQITHGIFQVFISEMYAILGLLLFFVVALNIRAGLPNDIIF